MGRKTDHGGVFPLRKGRFRWPALLLMMLVAAPIWGVDYESGDFRLSLGTTLSYGLTFRVQDRDMRIIGLKNGGKAFSVNGDDGDLNYDKGVVSNAAKVTAEVELSYKNFGAFVRGFAFYDIENEKGDRARSPLTDGALERVGSRADLRDAFVRLHGDFGAVPAQVRVGRQVLSWGESTFIPGGINTINPVDVSALRVPGFELREALLPVGLVWTSFGLSKSTALELYYQFEWEETVIDPPGTYFSTNDFAGLGGSRVMLGFGSVPDTLPIGPSPANPIGAVVPRQADRTAKAGGEYGAALRWFVPALEDTELGLYFVRYHSRLPVINAITGTLADLLPPKLNYASGARYFLSYPESIKLYGVSFNTQLGTTGVALQGEAAYRQDVPLQVDDIELLYAALTPLRLVTIPAYARVRAIGAFLAANNQLGAYGFGEVIEGYRRFDTAQFQMTATKAFGPMIGADQAVLVWEGAVSQVFDLPDKSVLRLEGPGTYVSGNPVHQAAGIQPGTEPASAFADDTSWGYVIAGRLDYYNAFANINLSPRIFWQHDVGGVSPGPGGNFIEGRTALTLGLSATYLINWEVDLSYTRYSGGGRYNLINDRDFVATNVKYTF